MPCCFAIAEPTVRYSRGVLHACVAHAGWHPRMRGCIAHAGLYGARRAALHTHTGLHCPCVFALHAWGCFSPVGLHCMHRKLLRSALRAEALWVSTQMGYPGKLASTLLARVLKS